MAREQDGDQVIGEVNPGGTEGGRRPTGVPLGVAGLRALPTKSAPLSPCVLRLRSLSWKTTWPRSFAAVPGEDALRNCPGLRHH